MRHQISKRPRWTGSIWVFFFHPFPSIVIGALVYGAISRLEAFKAPT